MRRPKNYDTWDNETKLKWEVRRQTEELGSIRLRLSIIATIAIYIVVAQVIVAVAGVFA